MLKNTCERCTIVRGEKILMLLELKGAYNTIRYINIDEVLHGPKYLGMEFGCKANA